MPRVDAEAWAAAGMPLPTGTIFVATARVALESLLQGQPYQLVSLGGFTGDELLDIELRELDAEGLTLRTLRAARAQVLPSGPTLVLYDGEVTANEVTRPFWRGSTRLALPGASYSAWLSAVYG